MDGIQSTDKGIYLFLYIQPGAKSNQWVGLHDKALKLRLKAPAVEGKANKALIAFLSEYFSLPMNQILITKGETSRKKTVFIHGLSEDDPKLIELNDLNT